MKTSILLHPVRLIALAAMIVISSGCSRSIYDPDRATWPYPSELHTTDTVDMQVFRDGEKLEIVNATARSYHDFDLWINQRYVRRVESLPAGKTLRLSLWDFYDERGDAINAGGFWRTVEPTPIRLVEIQTAADEPMIGLITIRAEAIEERVR